VPYVEEDVATSYGKTHVIISGYKSKKPLVFIHGMGSNSSFSRFFIAGLCENFYVYAIDIIGECGKSRPSKLPACGKDYADWLSEVLSELKIKRVPIIGVSFGGFVTHSLIQYFPNSKIFGDFFHKII
jgi:pimeloyl-ACP methyl ester carboxylesterase